MQGKRILIADSDQNNVAPLVDRCKTMGLSPFTASNAMRALNMIHEDPPDLLIIEVNFEGGNGLSVCEMLNADERLSLIPVIILTSRTDEETKNRCFNLGAHYVHKSIDAWDTIQPLICHLIGVTPDGSTSETHKQAAVEWKEKKLKRPPTLLVIDDDPHVARVMEIRLRPYGVRVLRAYSGMQGYNLAVQEEPDVIICDFIMPEGSGNFIYGKLASHDTTRNIPVIFLTGKTIDGRKDFGLARELTAMGAAAFITKPFDFDELLNELRKLITLPAEPNLVS